MAYMPGQTVLMICVGCMPFSSLKNSPSFIFSLFVYKDYFIYVCR